MYLLSAVFVKFNNWLVKCKLKVFLNQSDYLLNYHLKPL